MSDAKTQFEAIASTLTGEHEHVTTGRMMSSDGIQYKGKNFAFLHQDQIVVKLGRDTPPDSYGITEYSVLSPFKTKPPLKDWFEIAAAESSQWETLARQALERMVQQVDG